MQKKCNKFCLKFGKMAADTLKMLKHAFGEDALGQTPFNRFKSGRASVGGDEHSCKAKEKYFMTLQHCTKTTACSFVHRAEKCKLHYW